MKKFTISLIINILLAISFVLFLFLGNCKKQPEFIIRTDTIPGDSVPVYIPVDKPIPYAQYIDTGSVKIILEQIDSAQLYNIASCYFTKLLYCDTLKNDSDAFITLLDTVYMNQLHKRLLIYQNKRITQIINNIQQTDKARSWQLYAGAFTGGNLKGFDFGPAVLFTSAKNFGIEYRYHIINKEHFLTAYFNFLFLLNRHKNKSS